MKQEEKDSKEGSINQSLNELPTIHIIMVSGCSEFTESHFEVMGKGYTKEEAKELLDHGVKKLKEMGKSI